MIKDSRSPQTKSTVLNRDLMKVLWHDLNALAGDQSWLEWGSDAYLLELPHKWELSRVLLAGDTPLAYCIASRRDAFLWVHRLVVGMEFRGDGLGHTLLQTMEDLSREWGLKGILLKTPADNAAALRFYDREGFVQVPNQDNGYVLLRRMNDGKPVTVAIHQPNYFPWLGYFYKMSLSDVFVFLDDVTFSKGSFVNRNRVCINGEAKWLTVPLARGLQTPINEALPSSQNWAEKHLRTMEVSYGRAPFFEEYFGSISDTLNQSADKNAADLNISLVKMVANMLGITPQFFRSSDLRIDGSSDDRLVKIVQAVAGNIYVSGSGGANYQSEETFKAAGIGLSYTNFKPVAYRQLSPEFIPGLAVVDALFNVGADAIRGMFATLAADRGGTISTN